MDTKFPIIKNIDELGDSQLKEDALEILEEGYESIMVERLIKSKVELKDGHICFADKKICLDDYEKIYLIAFGKCAVSSATAFEEILGSKISGGIVLDVKKEDFKHLVSEEGTHPLSSPKNVFVTKNIVEILKEADKRDLILLVISGGGSSLLCLPYISEIENQKMLFQNEIERIAALGMLWLYCSLEKSIELFKQVEALAPEEEKYKEITMILLNKLMLNKTNSFN